MTQERRTTLSWGVQRAEGGGAIEPRWVPIAEGTLQDDLRRVGALLQQRRIRFRADERATAGGELAWRLFVLSKDVGRASHLLSGLGKESAERSESSRAGALQGPDLARPRNIDPRPGPLFDSSGRGFLRVALMLACFGISIGILVRSCFP